MTRGNTFCCATSRNRALPAPQALRNAVAITDVSKTILGCISYKISYLDGRGHAAGRSKARASAHWLRHTAGSHQADAGLDLRTVRDNLGHVSLTTTSVYLHEEEDTRHRQTVRGHRMNWSDKDPVEPPAREPQR
ncbi:site-specific integrase [Mycetohabitans sp. B4]|nr:site-specific integrase [Mycetohabitans sp. B3]MCG1018522.1 site-specific integrase [Mycetohabitans sp. B4]